ncbi:MAG: hypothetical protein KF894_27860 [Labilithrix sp.]|nr:hypothetical protein [Labilithrix sp.]
MGSDGGARTWKWTTAIGAWLLCASWATTARAAAFDLTWSAPEGCPSRPEMIAATRARLGASDAEVEEAPDLFVRGTVVAEPGGFLVSFRVEDAAGVDVGERELRVQQRDCRAIEEPAALVLATMISVVRPPDGAAAPGSSPSPGGQPDTRGAPGSRAPVTASGSRPPPSRRPPRRPSSAPPAPSPSPRPALDALAVASIGALPGAGLGVGLRTSFAVRERLVLGLETAFEAGASVRAGRGEVGFQLLSASLLAGVRVLPDAALELVPVVALRAGVLRTAPSGFQVVKAEAHPMAFAGLGTLLRASLAPRLHAEVMPQAELVLVRDVFQATEGRTTYRLHQPSYVGARLTIGIGYEFP